MLQTHFTFAQLSRLLTRSPPHSSKGHSGYPIEGPEALSRSPPLGGRESVTHHSLGYAKVPPIPSRVEGAGPASQLLPRAAGQRWSFPRQPTRVLTLGILWAPPRARRTSHNIEFGSPKGPKVSVCSELASRKQMKVWDRWVRRIDAPGSVPGSAVCYTLLSIKRLPDLQLVFTHVPPV